jgi:hypothetical protein
MSTVLLACGTTSTPKGAPGDSWACDCACDDPAMSGTTITVPVHGCAPTGISETDPQVVDKVCSSVCAPGATPHLGTDAFLGTCHSSAPGAQATLVAPNTCDPSAVTSGTAPVGGGGYHVTFDPTLSTMSLRAEGVSADRAVHGEMFFDLDNAGTPQGIGIEDLEVQADDESGITHVRIAAADQTSGMFRSASMFTIYNGLGVLVVRWQQDGQAEGINSVNYDAPWTGTIDLAGSHFALDLSGHDPSGTSRTLTAHLEGAIDNVPPIANAGQRQQTVTCTTRAATSVTLDASASTDPDAGDAITHYQWFTQSAQGVGNQAQTTVVLAIGQPSTFVLHVYDHELGATTASTTITVVDATPPCQ